MSMLGFLSCSHGDGQDNNNEQQPRLDNKEGVVSEFGLPRETQSRRLGFRSPGDFAEL